jgi:hypothetical protein
VSLFLIVSPHVWYAFGMRDSRSLHLGDSYSTWRIFDVSICKLAVRATQSNKDQIISEKTSHIVAENSTSVNYNLTAALVSPIGIILK